MKVVVLFHEFLQLTLDIGDFVDWELVFVQGHLSMFEITEETKFTGQKEEETFTLAATTSRSSHTMDVVTRIIWRVKLHNPIDRGNVQSTSSHVRAQQDPLISITEFEEGRGSFLLLLLALE